jgi:hypothetical protein
MFLFPTYPAPVTQEQENYKRHFHLKWDLGLLLMDEQSLVYQLSEIQWGHKPLIASISGVRVYIC